MYICVRQSHVVVVAVVTVSNKTLDVVKDSWQFVPVIIWLGMQIDLVDCYFRLWYW